MTDKTHVIEVPTERTAAIPADRSSLLTEVVARIRHHSQEKSAQYLEETKVPHGGE